MWQGEVCYGKKRKVKPRGRVRSAKGCACWEVRHQWEDKIWKRLAGGQGMSPVGVLTVFQAKGTATYCYIKDQWETRKTYL